MNPPFKTFRKVNLSLCLLLCVLSSLSAQKLSDQQGVLSGNVLLYEGNCMPGPGAPPCESRPIATTVYISSPALAFDRALLLDSAVSSEEGLFSIQLKPAYYSLFIKDEENVICDRSECPDECYCHPIKILPNDSLFTELKVNRAVW